MTDYRLHVDMLVPEGSVVEFEKSMRTFLRSGGFRAFHESFDTELVLALKERVEFDHKPSGMSRSRSAQDSASSLEEMFLSTEPGFYNKRFQNGEARPRVVRYVHLWTIPSVDDLDLARRMLYCAEDRTYMELDSFVVSETQNIVRAVRWQQPPEKPDPSTKTTIVRAIRELEYARLGDYLFSLRGLLPALKQRNWHHLGHFQNVTGPLNRIIEFWQTDGNSSLSDLFTASSEPVAAKRFGPPTVRDLVGKVASFPVSSVRRSFEWANYFESTSLISLRSRFLNARRARTAVR